MYPGMLDSFSVDTYRTYKRNTDEIAQWLVDTTVNTCGLPLNCGREIVTEVNEANSTSTPSEAIPKGRLKGKARKLAREKAATESTSTTSTNKTYKLDTSDFLLLAQGIAKWAGDKKCVPLHILNKIQATIDMRKEIAGYYHASGSSSTDAELAKSNDTHAHFIDQLERVLYVLKPLNADAPRPRPRTPVEDPEASEADAIENRFGRLELEELDRLCESAANIPVTPTTSKRKPKPAKRPNTTYKAVFYSRNKYHDMEFAAWCLFSDLHGIQEWINSIWKQVADGALDIITASVMTNVAVMITRAAENAFRESYPEINESTNILKTMTDLWLGDERKNGGVASRAGRCIIFGLHGSALTEKLAKHPQMKVMSAIILYSDADEITSGLATFHDRVDYPLWWVFALELFHGARLALEKEGVKAPFTQLKENLAWYKLNVTKLRAQIAKDTNWPADIELKPWDAALNKFFKRWEDSFTTAEELYAENPILCGEIQLATLMMYGQCENEDNYSKFVEIAHVYTFLRQIGYLDVEWHDMEHILHLINPDEIFLGPHPTTAEKCAQIYNHVFGFTARARKPRPAKPLGNRREKGKWAYHYLTDRMTTRERWQLNDVQKLVESFNEAIGESKPKKRGDTRPMKAPELLGNINSGLEIMLRRWRFDELGFHFRCRELIAKFASTLGGYIPDNYKPDKYKKAKLSMEDVIIPFLFREVGRKAPKAKEMCAKVAEIMKALMEEEGAVEVKKVGFVIIGDRRVKEVPYPDSEDDEEEDEERQKEKKEKARLQRIKVAQSRVHQKTDGEDSEE